MVSRLDALRAAVDSVLALPTIKQDPSKSPEENLVDGMRQIRKEAAPYRAGSMTEFVHSLDPQLKKQAIELATLYDHELDLGRHGDPEQVSRHFEVPQDILEQVRDGLVADEMTMNLIQRRPNDSTLPLPELDRRDYLRASMSVLAPPDEGE